MPLWFTESKLVELYELIIILACGYGKKMPKASAYDCTAHSGGFKEKRSHLHYHWTTILTGPR